MKFLHIGCGPKRKDRTTLCFRSERWHEARLDNDPNVFPHMAEVSSGSVQAIFCWQRVYHPFFDLWALASKSERSETEMREEARLPFPE